MILRRNLKFSVILHYTWRNLLYYISLSTFLVVIHDYFGIVVLESPSYTISALGIALAIFLGFKNDHAYDRWWEARKIWGLLVNYSRAWTRQATTFIIPTGQQEIEEVKKFQKMLVYRHIAFVHALRVFLRKNHEYNKTEQVELYQDLNLYSDSSAFISLNEYQIFRSQDNPPNSLIQKQGEDLQFAFKKGWLSDYRFVKMEETLVDFNDIQGMCERIKNTPLPRQYTFFSRIFVLIHCTLLPMVFISDIGWMTIPISLAVSFVFLALDLIGERTEDPFENRLEDTPMTSLGLTIETNLKEQLKESKETFPPKYKAEDGILF
ncbi:MAG: hypothetical protein M3512_07615 [Bacteroidota bacterium]|nr:hypothetical protein [Bacteroidota bacterium]